MLDTLKLAGLVPVIKVKRAEDAVPLCRALAEGGLPVAEITFPGHQSAGRAPLPGKRRARAAWLRQPHGH